VLARAAAPSRKEAAFVGNGKEARIVCSVFRRWPNLLRTVDFSTSKNGENRLNA
jgi:hypothetical protein